MHLVLSLYNALHGCTLSALSPAIHTDIVVRPERTATVGASSLRCQPQGSHSANKSGLRCPAMSRPFVQPIHHGHGLTEDVPPCLSLRHTIVSSFCGCESSPYPPSHQIPPPSPPPVTKTPPLFVLSQVLAVGLKPLCTAHWANRFDLLILVASTASYVVAGIPGSKRALYIDRRAGISDLVELPRAVRVLRCVRFAKVALLFSCFCALLVSVFCIFGRELPHISWISRNIVPTTVPGVFFATAAASFYKKKGCRLFLERYRCFARPLPDLLSQQSPSRSAVIGALSVRNKRPLQETQKLKVHVLWSDSCYRSDSAHTTLYLFLRHQVVDRVPEPSQAAGNNVHGRRDAHEDHGPVLVRFVRFRRDRYGYLRGRHERRAPAQVTRSEEEIKENRPPSANGHFKEAQIFPFLLFSWKEKIAESTNLANYLKFFTRVFFFFRFSTLIFSTVFCFVLFCFVGKLPGMWQRNPPHKRRQKRLFLLLYQRSAEIRCTVFSTLPDVEFRPQKKHRAGAVELGRSR